MKQIKKHLSYFIFAFNTKCMLWPKVELLSVFLMFIGSAVCVGVFSILDKIYMKLRCIEAYRTKRRFNTWKPRKSHIPRSRYSFASISVSTYFTQWVWEKWKKLQNFTLILMTSMALLKYFFISVYWRYYWRFDRTCRSIEQGHSERTRLVIVCNSFVGFFCRYVFDQSV